MRSVGVTGFPRSKVSGTFCCNAFQDLLLRGVEACHSVRLSTACTPLVHQLCSFLAALAIVV